uniref:NUC domain-containing protein n=1 Tax=Loa loa TaxID=7209 RepID=A0A1I7VSA2_LOALO
MCRINRQMHTELENGTIRMLNDTTSECQYRCLHMNGELNLKPSNWIKMKKNEAYYESCEFIETHCMKNKKTTFRYIHDQARRNSEVLRQLYDATTFYYHNKVGLNSRPNAFAIFSGTRISTLDENFFPDKSDSEYPDSCKNGVKRNETITYDFIDQSYASVIAEDWIGAFNWPNCKGYDQPPTDHFCNALVLRSTGKQPNQEENDFDNYFYKGECQEPYHKLMNFVSKFLNEYNGISKFAMIWLSLIAHDSPNGLYRTDKYFANFFRKHVKDLNNSFVFLMGDHGIRFGNIRSTRPGQMEDNNPLFTVALPKYLRSNEQLILNLKQNSRRHTSQFDFYATLYDIARYARKDNFQKWDEHDFRNEFGEIRGGIRAKSILRPISYDRTCEEMEIPEEYCICEQTWHKINIYGDDVTEAAQLLIASINDFLKQKNLTGTCEVLDFIEVISAESFEAKSLLDVVVRASPSNGKYEAQLLKKKDKFEIITKITRLDEYGNQGYCAPDEEVRSLCYCRQQLTTFVPH